MTCVGIHSNMYPTQQVMSRIDQRRLQEVSEYFVSSNVAIPHTGSLRPISCMLSIKACTLSWSAQQVLELPTSDTKYAEAKLVIPLLRVLPRGRRIAVTGISSKSPSTLRSEILPSIAVSESTQAMHALYSVLCRHKGRAPWSWKRDGSATDFWSSMLTSGVRTWLPI